MYHLIDVRTLSSLFPLSPRRFSQGRESKNDGTTNRKSSFRGVIKVKVEWNEEKMVAVAHWSKQSLTDLGLGVNLKVPRRVQVSENMFRQKPFLKNSYFSNKALIPEPKQIHYSIGRGLMVWGEFTHASVYPCTCLDWKLHQQHGQLKLLLTLSHKMAANLIV